MDSLELLHQPSPALKVHLPDIVNSPELSHQPSLALKDHLPDIVDSLELLQRTICRS